MKSLLLTALLATVSMPALAQDYMSSSTSTTSVQEQKAELDAEMREVKDARNATWDQYKEAKKDLIADQQAEKAAVHSECTPGADCKATMGALRADQKVEKQEFHEERKAALEPILEKKEELRNEKKILRADSPEEAAKMRAEIDAKAAKDAARTAEKAAREAAKDARKAARDAAKAPTPAPAQ